MEFCYEAQGARMNVFELKTLTNANQIDKIKTFFRWNIAMLSNKLIFVVPILFSGAVLAKTPTECDYLRDSSLPTRGWVNQYDDEYGCSSDYLKIGSDSPLSNNIAYYVEGDSNSANSAKLVMNINNNEYESKAETAFIKSAQELSKKIINDNIPNDILKAIKGGENLSIIIKNTKVETKTINWISGNGYEKHIIFKIK